MPTSHLRQILPGVGLAAALLVAGCGVKPAQLEPPASADPADIRDPETEKAPPPDGEKPDRPFVLDGLLM